MVLPTLYEYYVSSEIKSGLNPTANGFYLNGKEISIHSGAIHYFRVPKAYWGDRLRKARAAGLNAVETYVPWNLHEPQRGMYDFGDGENDFSEFLDVVKFIKMARKEDLFVIVRPGPYICSEWEFGGLPSWLLNEEGLIIRTSEPKFMRRVTDYFARLLPLFTDLQFTKGGPIVAFQIENEYGSVGSDTMKPDIEYMKSLQNIFTKHGLVELFFTSDSPHIHRDTGSIPGVLQTANFKEKPELELNILKELQPNKPLLVTEYWTGWFDHWMVPYHETEPVDVYSDVLERILKFPASVNLYMFHGGTNFAFMNGANIDKDEYEPDVTSYDYDAPLSEAGDYTEKFYKTVDLLAKYQKVKTRLPELPPESKKVAYPTLRVAAHLTYEDILDQVNSDAKVKLLNVATMEDLPINGGNGQSYGYVVYRKKVHLQEKSVIKLTGHVHDTLMVLVDGKLESKILTSKEDIRDFGDAELALETSSRGEKTLDLVVENWARVNFGYIPQFLAQKKGLGQGPVLLDGKALSDWDIYALEFKRKWVESLTGWRDGAPANAEGPTISKFILDVEEPRDTFVDQSDWFKGLVFVNGFNLGRYCNLGPQKTLYLPAPFLKGGRNEILAFEHFRPNSDLRFLDHPILGPLKSNF